MRALKLISAVALAAASCGSHAALTTLTAVDGWPPLGSSGLEGVQFNVNTAAGVKVATGAHAYKEGTAMPNNGSDTFYANPGFSPNPNLTYARWSLDYAINYGTGKVQDYVTTFSFDIDPTTGVNFKDLVLDATTCDDGPVNVCAFSVVADSQNPVFVYGLLATLGSGFAFNPTDLNGHYAFKVSVTGPGLTGPLGSTINVDVPEPGSLALAGLALVGLASTRRRKA